MMSTYRSGSASTTALTKIAQQNKRVFQLCTAMSILLLCSLPGLCLPASVYAQSFNKTYGLPSGQYTFYERGTSIANTLDGNYIVAGTNLTNFTSPSIITMKLTTSGTVLWGGHYVFPAAPGESEAYCIDQAVENGQDDGYIVTGYYKGVYTTTSNDVVRRKLLLLKLNPNGSIDWQRAFGSDAGSPETGDDVEGRFVIQTPDQGFVATGFSKDRVTGVSSVVLVRVNASGTLQWFHTYTTASVSSTTNAEGWCVRQVDDNANGMIDNNDGFIITGTYGGLNLGGNHAFVMKVQANGTLSWVRKYHETYSQEYAYHIEPLALGNNGYIITGKHVSTQFLNRDEDVFLLRITSTGGFLWAKAIGDVTGTPPTLAGDHGYSVKEDQNGDFVIAGGSHSYNPPEYQGILYKVDPAGNLLSAHHFGGSEDDGMADIVVAPDGGYAMVGSSVNFTPDSDVYVVETGATGAICRALECQPHNFPLRMEPQPIALSADDDIHTYTPRLDWGNPVFATTTECNRPTGLLQHPTGVSEEDYAAAGLTLSPNPAAAGTCNAAFTVEQGGRVELTVYDALGRMMAAPLAHYLPEGSYSIPIDSRNFAPGTYFCRLTIAGRHVVLPLVVAP